jgi:fatty-acid peroxygenase
MDGGSDDARGARRVGGIPRDREADGTLALLREGYAFVGNRCRRNGADAFRTRLMLRPVVCMSGPEAARVFYGAERFTRRRAMPLTTLKLLQDKGSVQQLEGEAHRVRKAMFTRMLDAEADRRLAGRVEEAMRRRIPEWAARGRFPLLGAMREAICRAVCDEAGVPLAERDVPRRAAELGALVDGAGSVGVRALVGLARRDAAERWARSLVDAGRARTMPLAKGTMLRAILDHRDADGSRLSPDAAVVELLNVLRPAVAVANFAVFAAKALHEQPRWRDRLAAGDAADLRDFVQEVRRTAPFFPFVAGRVAEPFEWRGHVFRRGAWTIFDVWGTGRDPRIWDEPDAFRPERHRGRRPDPFDMVAQGAGDVRTGHRCPGEDATVAVTAAAVRVLVSAMDWRVAADQDLSVRLDRIPAMPEGGLVIEGVRAKEAPARRPAGAEAVGAADRPRAPAAGTAAKPRRRRQR